MTTAKNRNPGTLPPRASDGHEKRRIVMRRRHQDGQLIETTHGWSARFYESGEGQRRRVQVFLGSFEELTKPQAKTAMAELLAKVNKTPAALPQTDTTTFRTVATKWIADCETRKQKPSTICNWRSILKNHLNPLIGEIPVAEVKSKTLKNVVERLVKKELSPQTLKNILQVAKLLVASVVDDEGDPVYERKWNARFIGAPKVEKNEQKRPTFSREQVTKIVQAARGRIQMACVLFAATGLRAGELLGLECKHFDGQSVKVAQAVWGGSNRVVKPKTCNADRTVDLHPDVAALLKSFIGGRTVGFIFQTSSRRPITQTNLLRRELHPLLEELGIPVCGFHAFRRFRNTYLRQEHCPDGLLKYWLGHAGRDMSDHYDKSSEDVQYRRDVAKSMGVGFELPKALTPKAKISQSGVIGRQAETVESETIACKPAKTLEKVGVSDGI
jgi:integrase